MFINHVIIFLTFAVYNNIVNNLGIPPERIITTLNYSKFRVKPTIVNGEPAERGQLPYLVSFKITGLRWENKTHKSNFLYLWDNICGGSIINSMHVLTAAHCFEADGFFLTKHTAALRVVAGTLQNGQVHTGNTETKNDVQWRGVKKIRLHEHFNFPLNDIALVTVDTKFVNNDDVGPITYVRSAVDYPEVCKSAGFGFQSYDPERNVNQAPLLMIALIKTMPRWQCSAIWEMDMNTYVCSQSVISDVAVGDSGGPLACRGTWDLREEPGKDMLVGIVSGKSFDKTTLFTRVSAYTDWIEGARTSGTSKMISESVSIVIVQCLFYIYLFIPPAQMF